MMGQQQTMMVKRTLLLLSVMVATLIAASGVAFAVSKVCSSGTTQANPCSGTKGIDTLIGTSGVDYIMGLAGNDKISAGGGNDTTDGGAGNDTYSYTDGWGVDTLIDSGGTDTLNFSAITGISGHGVEAYLVDPDAANGNYVTGYNGERINLSSGTVIEKITGSSGHDDLRAGGAANTLQPGPGTGGAIIRDLGGVNGRPASSDTYSGFSASGYGHVRIEDYGGTADKLVLPFASTDVYLEAIDADDDPALDTLVIMSNATDSIEIVGQLEPWYEFPLHLEQIVFTDETMTIGSDTAVQTLNAASSLDKAEKEKRSKAAKKVIEEEKKP